MQILWANADTNQNFTKHLMKYLEKDGTMKANQNANPTVRNFLAQRQQEVRQIRSNQHSAAQQQQQQQQQYGLPSSTTSCVSSTMVIIIIALLQSVALGQQSDKAKFY
ncbi:hypothetical protein GPALN_009755 [Globodera pallida]|nr:hypothetical protein GPALN_009755 [Globodera pallida]